MKSINMQELLIGPLAMICVVVVFVAAVLDLPQDAGPAPTIAIGSPR